MTTGPRSWPPDVPLEPEDCVETRCAVCQVPWRIHRDLQGGKLRCQCGAWVEVPRSAQAAAPAAPVKYEVSRLSVGTAPAQQGTLRDADVDTRRRATDRIVFEMAALGAAFTMPPLAVFLFSSGEQRALLTPFSSLASGLLVLLIGVAAGGWAFAALKPTRSRYLAEAVAASALAAGLALGWVALLESLGASTEDPLLGLRSELGMAWAILLVGVCPAVFEELAFRGLLQQRLTTLFGPRSGILLTGTAFALAHGVTAGLPFHAGLGIYLCWLRARCGSLYPGMLLHFVYNTTLVVCA